MEFRWLSLHPSQRGLVEALFERARVRFGLPEGIQPTGTWEAIVADGHIVGVVGTAWASPGVLDVTGLYVYPTKAGKKALDATIERFVRLYETGAIRGLICTVAWTNVRMQRVVEHIGASYGMGKPRAVLYAAGEV